MSIHPLLTFGAVAALTAASLVGLAMPADANAVEGAPSQIVHFDDLNLASGAGVQALYRRVQTAARDVCGPAEVTGARILSQDWKDCVSETVRSAIFAINRPQLTAYYADHLRVAVSRTAG